MSGPRDVFIVKIPFRVAEQKRAQLDAFSERVTDGPFDSVNVELIDPPFCKITVRIGDWVEGDVDAEARPFLTALLAELGFGATATITRDTVPDDDDDWDDDGEDDGSVSLVIRLPGDFKEKNAELLKRIWTDVTATGVAKVVGEVSMGGIDVVLIVDVDPAHVAELDTKVRPKIEAVLARLGLAGIAALEVAKKAGDDE